MEGLGRRRAVSGAGVEYRKDSLGNNAGDLPFALRTDFPLQYGDSFAGDTEVGEGFLELEMPLLKDVTMAKQLTLNGAVRYAHYKTNPGEAPSAATLTGHHHLENCSGVGSHRVAAIPWQSFEGPAGWRSRELFYSLSIPAGSVNNPCQNPPVNGASDNSVLIPSGNPDIKPETATTTTAGFVLSPSGWARGMHFSADYYDIKLDDGMASGNVQNNINQCSAGVAYYCQFVTFGTPLPGNTPRSNITSTRAIVENQQSYKATGIDFSWDYFIPLESIFHDAPGDLSFRLTATHAIEMIIPTTPIVGTWRDRTAWTRGSSRISLLCRTGRAT